MTDTESDRRAGRFPIPLQVYCSFEQVDGIASLVDISYTGALLEDTEMRPKIGTHINLSIYFESPVTDKVATHFELTGVVVRHNSNGFAVKFESDHDPAVHGMLGAAAEIMAASR